MRPLTLASLLALSACPGPEQGLDKTVIRGLLEIPPWAGTEGPDSDKVENAEWVNATTLEPLTWRQMNVTGNTRFFGGVGQMGDEDRYTLDSQGDGTLQVTLAFTTGISGETDLTTYTLELYDLSVTDEDGEVVTAVSVASSGTHGLVTATLPVTRGGSYGIGVLAGRSTEFDSGDYTFTVTSLTPSDGQFLVGAYLEEDPTLHTAPVGGAAVDRMSWDAQTATWRGTFEIFFVREVIPDTAQMKEQAERYEGDTGRTLPPVWTTDETLETVYLAGGNLTGLNASIGAGTLFSATSKAVDASAHGEDGIVGGWAVGLGPAGSRISSDVVVVVDTIRPRVIGWEFTETEPNDVAVDPGTYALDPAGLDAAETLPVASGPGYVDVIHGEQLWTVDDPAWGDGGDVDVFALTVPSTVDLVATLTWPDPAEDLDMHLYDAGGVLIAAGWAVANSDPEVFSTVTDFGLALDPKTEYYLAILGYTGPAGTRAYTVDMEYAAP
jgi:hypothetical protein